MLFLYSMIGMGWLADGSVNPSVIYSSYLEKSIPKLPTDDVIKTLKQSFINTIVTGHQPHGDAPLLLNLNKGNDNDGIQVSFTPFSF